MRLIIKVFILILSIAVFSNCKKEHKKEAEQWVSLFNGTDLTGWIVKINGYELNNNYNNTFRAENGVIKVSYDQYDHLQSIWALVLQNTFFKLQT